MILNTTHTHGTFPLLVYYIPNSFCGMEEWSKAREGEKGTGGFRIPRHIVNRKSCSICPEMAPDTNPIDPISTYCYAIKKEIEERNPTPVERLEMRSMDSFPYSVTLTDYWSDKEGYDATGSEDKEEFTITKGDVDSYSANEIEDSFGYDKNDQNSQKKN